MKKTNSTSIFIPTGAECGHRCYITYSRETNKFRRDMGKNGGCVKCHSDVLSDIISLGLKRKLEWQDIINIFKDVCCPAPRNWGENQNKSCFDGIARYIEGDAEQR